MEEKSTDFLNNCEVHNSYAVHYNCPSQISTQDRNEMKLEESISPTQELKQLG